MPRIGEYLASEKKREIDASQDHCRAHHQQRNRDWRTQFTAKAVEEPIRNRNIDNGNGKSDRSFLCSHDQLGDGCVDPLPQL